MRCRTRHVLSVAATAMLLGCGDTSGDGSGTGSGATTTSGPDAATDTSGGTTSDGGASTDATTNVDSGSDDGTTGEPGELVGSFLVQLAEPAPPAEGTTSLFGKIFDGPTPLPIVWETAATDGDCVLLTPRVPFCSTPCEGGAACVEDETCAPYPMALAAGDITVEGVGTTTGEATFTMSPVAENYQPPAGVVLAFPGVVEGEPVTLTAAGDVVEAFVVETAGITPLFVETEAFEIGPDADLLLAWAPPADSTASQMHVEIDISHHGGTKGVIECEADDTGTLRIAASLLSGLLDLGVAGFPHIVIRRESTAWTNVGVGRIDLVVSSSIDRPVVIEGLVSCDDDDDCPERQTCQEDLTCQ